MTDGALARRGWLGDGGSPELAKAAEREPAGAGSPRPLLLIADDEPTVLQMLERLADRLGFDVVTCDGGQAAIRAMLGRPADVALVDLRMPDVDGIEVLRQVQAEAPSCAVVIMTAYGAIDSAVEAMKLGAREYITKPFDFAQLRQLLIDIRDEIDRRRERPVVAAPDQSVDLRAMLGDTPVMIEVSNLIRTLAPSAKVVLVTGERGTGKELVARALHESGPRRSKPFVSINCAAQPDAWFGREVFGHDTDVSGGGQSKPGLLEAANGGTVFFDDIGELPLAVQATLVQTLDSGELRRVGAQRRRKVDVAVIAATRHDLRAAVAAGRFRADLYYRLSIVGIVLPPLRERPEDIKTLASAFLREDAARRGKWISGFSADALAALCAGRWEGNVRELRACIERVCAHATGATIGADEVLAGMRDLPSPPALRVGGLHVVRSGATGPSAADTEKEHILSVLHTVRGNRTAAARVLGLSRRALNRRLAQHQIANETMYAVPTSRRGEDPSHD